MYITDEEIAGLPADDPEEAFIALERIVRTRLEEACAQLEENESSIGYQRKYMSVVLPAARHYRIKSVADWARPGVGEDNWQVYQQFFADVDHTISELRLRSADRTRQHSVALDAATKIKLRHLLAQIRETVDKLDVSVAKKDRLYARITALQEEIERERTRYQAFAALVIEAADDAGEAASRLEPLVRLIERVGAAIGVAKRFEDAKPKLPPRQERKRIEQRKELSKRIGKGFDKAIDGEIPF